MTIDEVRVPPVQPVFERPAQRGLFIGRTVVTFRDFEIWVTKHPALAFISGMCVMVVITAIFALIF